MQESLEHFRTLLKFDTSNPPGNEMPAILYIKEKLDAVGLKPFIHETAPGRGNIVVRLKGNGEKKPFLMSSHVDVVHAEPEKWTFDPFAAIEKDGVIYGRGAIDMKNFTAVGLATILKAHREKWNLKRDLILSAVSDEEAGGKFGMEKLVREHPELVRAEFALGEVGGYTSYIGDKPIYPIQVGEKGTHWIEVTFHGEPGHGSVPNARNVHWRVARFIGHLENRSFPFHLTGSFSTFVDGLAQIQGPLKSPFVKLLKMPLAPKIVKNLVRRGGSQKVAGILAMMTNTVNPTGLNSGKQVNVVPSAVTLRLDCRLIPGVSSEVLMREIEMVTGEKLEPRILSSNPGHESPVDTPLFRLMKTKVEEAHPGSVGVPWLTVGYTDASQLIKLGNICYGFTPVKLTPDLDFTKLYHGHDERVPIEGFLWGARVFEEVVRDFCCL